MSLTVGELQVLLTGDTRPLDRALDKVDDRGDQVEKSLVDNFDKAGRDGGKALDKGVQTGLDKTQARVKQVGMLVNAEAINLGLNVGKSIDSGVTDGMAGAGERAVDALTRDVNGKLRNARGQFASEAEKIAAGFADELGKGGEEAGGRLAQGINSGLTRNSPLIVAAITGALAAGAPAAIAGASLLFAGIGAAAASQFPEVRTAWTDLWSEIKAGAAADVEPLIPVYVGVADKIGAAFQALRPQLRDAFAAAAPGIEKFTDGVLGAANNAMPALVRAVERSGPVMDGLQSLLTTVGTGLGQMFDNISEHSGAAGTAFAAIGDALGSVLPLLGTMLGTGAELASVVLPPIATALSAVASAAEALGPLLPAIVLGFAGMKVAGAITGGMTSLGGSLAKVAQNAAQASYDMDGFVGRSAGKASDVASRTGRAFSTMGDNIGKAGLAIPALGMVLAGISSNLSDASSEEDRWAQAILAGGQAATDAFAQYQSGTHWGQSVDEATGLASSWNDAAAKADELRAAMTPLQLAQSNAAAAQANLQAVVAQYGPTSAEAQAAAGAYAAAQSEVESQSGRTELAIDGVTTAMIDQANQALAAIDSGFAYQNNLNGLEDAQAALADAQAHLNDVNVDTRTTSEDVSRAQLALAEQNYQTALSFGQQQADMSGAGKETAQYARIVQEQALQELYRLRDAAGPDMAGALNQQIGMLEASGVSLAGTGQMAGATAERMRDLGVAVTEVPGSKGVYIDAPTADQQKRIEDLGYTVVHLPNGKVYVTANTEDAAAKIAGIQAQINGLRDRTITITTRATADNTDLAGNQLGLNRPGAAIGGRIGDVVRGFSAGGKLSGPGTPTSDSIPAMTYSGIPLRVADDEWVIKARSAALYGGRAMAAVNAGTARIYTPTGSSSGATTSTGSGSVVHKHYHLSTVVREVLTTDQIMRAVRQEEAIYG